MAELKRKNRYVGAQVTEDGNYLLVSASKSTSECAFIKEDLTQADAELVPMVSDYKSDHYLLDSEGSTL